MQLALQPIVATSLVVNWLLCVEREWDENEFWSGPILGSLLEMLHFGLLFFKVSVLDWIFQMNKHGWQLKSGMDYYRIFRYLVLSIFVAGLTFTFVRNMQRALKAHIGKKMGEMSPKFFQSFFMILTFQFYMLMVYFSCAVHGDYTGSRELCHEKVSNPVKVLES